MPLRGQSPIHVQSWVICIPSADLMPFFSLSVPVMPAFFQFFIRSSVGSYLASAWSTHFLLTWAPSVILLELNINVTLSKMPFLNFQPKFVPHCNFESYPVLFLHFSWQLYICLCLFYVIFLTRPLALGKQWLPIVPGTECVLCVCCRMGEGVFIDWKPDTTDSTVSRGPNLRNQLKHTYIQGPYYEKSSEKSMFTKYQIERVIDIKIDFNTGFIPRIINN